jgi:hypothetical protein
MVKLDTVSRGRGSAGMLVSFGLPSRRCGIFGYLVSFGSLVVAV